MTEEKIASLHVLLKEHICTLKKTSLDGINKKYMCSSKMKVVNFDKVPNKYAKDKGLSGVPKSNDALYIDAQGKWYFIEFKNGRVHTSDIYRKIYDSLIMLIDCRIVPDFDFVRKNINYILVYNPEKCGKIPESPSREQNYDYFFKLAKQEKKLFEVEKFEKYLFNETHTYTPELFEKDFVRPMECEENLVL